MLSFVSQKLLPRASSILQKCKVLKTVSSGGTGVIEEIQSIFSGTFSSRFEIQEANVIPLGLSVLLKEESRTAQIINKFVTDLGKRGGIWSLREKRNPPMSFSNFTQLQTRQLHIESSKRSKRKRRKSEEHRKKIVQECYDANNKDDNSQDYTQLQDEYFITLESCCPMCKDKSINYVGRASEGGSVPKHSVHSEGEESFETVQTSETSEQTSSAVDPPKKVRPVSADHDKIHAQRVNFYSTCSRCKKRSRPTAQELCVVPRPYRLPMTTYKEQLQPDPPPPRQDHRSDPEQEGCNVCERSCVPTNVPPCPMFYMPCKNCRPKLKSYRKASCASAKKSKHSFKLFPKRQMSTLCVPASKSNLCLAPQKLPKNLVFKKLHTSCKDSDDNSEKNQMEERDFPSFTESGGCYFKKGKNDSVDKGRILSKSVSKREKENRRCGPPIKEKQCSLISCPAAPPVTRAKIIPNDSEITKQDYRVRVRVYKSPDGSLDPCRPLVTQVRPIPSKSWLLSKIKPRPPNKPLKSINPKLEKLLEEASGYYRGNTCTQ